MMIRAGRMVRMWRHMAPLLAILSVAVLGSCGSSEPAGGDATALLGTWHYVGAQTSGDRIAYDGTVTITQAAGSDFTGGFDVQSSTPQGGRVEVNGVISGRMGENAVDFDLQLTDDTRRHVGNIAGDSIKGSWANDDLTSLGTFTMARSR